MRIRAALAVALAALAFGCSPTGVHDRFAAEVGPGKYGDDDGGDDASDVVEPPDADPNVGGPCVDDDQCKLAGVTCATWVCDKAAGRCRATPDDTRCDDGIYCDGVETCDPRLGCRPGAVVDCSTGDTCSIDRCVEATRSCTHARRDADGDGDPASACGGGDCDDRDPTVSSKTAEICGNGKDDNCNGKVDETPCVSPKNSTCGDALVVTGTSSFSVALAATARSVSASCASTADFPRQVVLAVKVPAGGAQDVDVVATPASSGRVSLAAGTICGDGGSETACEVQSPASASIRMRLRSLAPGTYPVYVFGATEADVDVHVSYLPPTTPPTNLSCGAATPMLDGTTTTYGTSLVLVDPGTLPSACSSGVGPLVYRVDVPAASAPLDLHVHATSDVAGVETILGLRDDGCVSVSNELRCGQGSPGDLFVRALPAGTYYVTVAASAPSDVAIDAELVPATPAPADATCSGAPPLPIDTTMIANLAGHEDAIAASCLWPSPPPPNGAPPLEGDAAYDLELANDSDVLVVVGATGNDVVGVGLALPACTTTTYGCAAGYPLRLSRRALPAGSYRVIVESALRSQVSLSTFVRDAATPGPVGADACSDAPVVIPPTGGLFVGSTATKAANFGASCDQGGEPAGGAPDVVYRLDLAAKSRVVLDASGSAYATTLSVRAGATCPGAEVGNGCAAGFLAGNAFLDLVLDPDTYWVVVDGYALASGSYRLDVRVAPPPP